MVVKGHKGYKDYQVEQHNLQLIIIQIIMLLQQQEHQH
jgi:hypothetical protein